MKDEVAIRSLLIDSCHASKEATRFFDSQLSDPDLLALLIRIAEDEDDHQGDAPLQAAYYVSQFPSSLLVQHEVALIRILPQANGYGGHIAAALGKIQSTQAKALLEQELGDGTRFDAWLFKQALSNYR